MSFTGAGRLTLGLRCVRRKIVSDLLGCGSEDSAPSAVATRTLSAASRAAFVASSMFPWVSVIVVLLSSVRSSNRTLAGREDPDGAVGLPATGLVLVATAL
jgi:hypothetical protein